MKKIKSLIALTLCAMAVIFTACKTEEPEVFGKPVLGTNFTVTVTGNNVILNCTMKTATSVLWQASNGEQKTKKLDTLYLPIAGDYNVVLNVSNGGDYLASDTVKFAIVATDDAYYNQGIWKALTGGANAKKTWILDVAEVVTTTIDDAGVSTSTSAYVGKYFHNALDFYGDATAGGSVTNVWGPWGGTNIYGWGGTPEEGEISFDAKTGIVSSTIDGTAKSGKYAFKFYDRDPNFCTLTANNGGGTLWENMLNPTSGKYNYLGTLSAQMGDLKFPSGMRFPLDRGRITNDGNTTNPSQFLTEDLENVTIMHLSDSAMVVRVKRTYEGANASSCWLLYNFIVKEYTYPTPKTYTHPVKSITASDLVGDWKLADVPGNWIGWAAKNELNTWADGAAMNTTFAGWSVANTTEKLAASKNVSLKFEANGNCTIMNAIFNSTTVLEADTTYNTTYSVSNGYITFGKDVKISGYTDMLTLTGKNVYSVDVAGSTTGLWLGQNNGTKSESTAVHIIKK